MDTSDVARHWLLDPDITFLNHGSYGACPIPVLEYQQALRERIEREPVRFFSREYPGLLDAALGDTARFLGADPEDTAFVPNATTGVNAVLKSLPVEPGDELLTTNHEYNACRNTLENVAARTRARVVVARIPFPISAPEEAVEAIVARVSRRTRIAVVDHVTSQTGLVLPVERIVAALRERGIETLVDGAHGPGMLPLSIPAIGAAFYTGNCHKWICAPKGAAILWVRRDLQGRVRPVVTSHGANTPSATVSLFRREFDWTGTDDPTAYLSVPEAIRFLGSLLPGGWPALREANRALALEGRRILAESLGVPLPCPDDMIGSLASVPIPDGDPDAPRSPRWIDPLQDALLYGHAIEAPVIFFPEIPRRVIRISAQVYNARDQYERLASALRQCLREDGGHGPRSRAR